MSRTGLRGTVFSYSSLMLLARLLAMASGIMVIRWMEPERLGIWLGLQLIALYGVHAHFGLIQAVNRQVPYYNGREVSLRARHIASVTRGTLLLGSALALAVLLGLYGMGIFHTVERRVLFFVTASTILALNVEFHIGLFRARHQFTRAGAIALTNALVVVMGLPLVYYFDLEGLAWRALAAGAIALFLCTVMDGGYAKITLDWREASGLVPRVTLALCFASWSVARQGRYTTSGETARSRTWTSPGAS